MFRKPIMILLSILMIITLVLPSLPARAADGRVTSHFGGDQSWIDLTLSTAGAPGVGGTADLALDGFTQLDAPALHIHWEAPAGVELVGTADEDLGALAAGQSFRSLRQVRFPAEGIYQITAQASYSPGAGMDISGAAVLFFTIRVFGSQVSYIDPLAFNPNHTQIPTEVTAVPAAPAAPGVPAAPGAVASTPCFTVKGNVTRTDREANKDINDNFTYKDTTKPFKHVQVEVREEDLIADDSYGEVYTDDNGDYALSFCDDDGLFDNTLEIYVRVRVELFYNGQAVVQVEDSSWVDETYEFDSSIFTSGGGTITYNLFGNVQQSKIFNIAEAVFDAWRYWNLSGGEDGGDAIFQGEAEVHYEEGYGDDGSYYNPYQNEITIADSVDPDAWDDSVIIHEWGHYSDDWYGCDDAGSGEHFINQILEDPELAWSEGYSNYWQSAVRDWRADLEPSYYFDLNASGFAGIAINLETYDTDKPSVKSSLNEMSVAGALWDLNDDVNDGQDMVTFGHAAVQKIFTSDEFQSVAYGVFDDTCSFDTYLEAWTLSYPKDTATAAVVWQNTGYVLTPSGALADAESAGGLDLAAEAGPASPLGGGGGVPPASGLDDGMWWNQVTYVADNSASMAGGKFTAVKTALNEAVNDLGSQPSGTEFSLYTFNNTSSQNTAKFAGQFYPANLTSTINGLTTSASADPLCKTYALRALDQAIMNQGKGDMWLFTDGDTDTTSPSLDLLAKNLNDRQIRASVALMGTCAPVQMDESQPTPEAAAAAAAEQTALDGAARNLLGPAADGAPSGLVPYLLTAMNTGGQFLYVSPAQASSAAEILRAQITHSAGAGRWSDYVSDAPTYQYEKLATWEYGWVDARTNGVSAGSPGSPSTSVTINLASNFRFYNNRSGYSSLTAYQYGYLVFGTSFGSTGTNTSLPNAAVPNNVLYPLWDGLAPLYVLCDQQGVEQTNCGLTGEVYTQSVGDWFVIEYDQYVASVGGGSNTFEVLLNSKTGEIRYQYQTVPSAGTATIGLENSTGTSAVQVSYNDLTGATNGMGYKFTPAPPQPSKIYTVTVDSMMSNVGFLLTGYSGDFDPMTLKSPSNAVLTCASKGVTCLNLGLVQYMEVAVNAETGVWSATVSAGPSGGGSFSFTSMAVGELKVQGSGGHKISPLGAQFVVDMGKTVDGGILSGQFSQPDGSLLGGAFSLFDDGLHGDGVAGDGRFGSLPGLYPGKGTGYLNVSGHKGGVPFKRVEAAPYVFQPVAVTALNKTAFNQGGGTALTFAINNLDSVSHCYTLTSQVPTGWWLSGLGVGRLCLAAGQTYNLPLTAYLTAGFTNSLPSGTTGEVLLGAVEEERGEISANDVSVVTRSGAAASIQIVAYAQQIKPNGEQANLEFWVTDASGFPVADGTLVNLSATPGGTLTPTSGGTLGGLLKAVYTSGAATGLMTITAQTQNAVSANTTLEVSLPEPNQISIQLSKHQMPADNSSTATVTALVLDRYGNPAANKTVHLLVNGDGEGALFGGAQIVTLTTNASGVVSAVLTSGKAAGMTLISAELVVNGAVVQTASDQILLGSQLMLPLLRR